jgi:putative ABC transport system substrate-binding protein
VWVASPAAWAQSAGKPIRVGVLLSGSPEQWSVLEQALVEGLHERGYDEGRNLTLLRRYGGLQATRIRAAAAELAGLKVDAIVTSCVGTTRAAASAAPDTPIVFVSVADPVLYGLVQSLPRPGGNVTGRASMSVELVPKRLEILRSFLPEGARSGLRVAVLAVADDPWHEHQWRSAQGVAAVLNLNPVRVPIAMADVDAALATLARSQAQAVLVLTDNPMMVEKRAAIAAALIGLKLPSISGMRLHAEVGGLAAYGPDVREDCRLSAAHVIKVAHGASPATLPIEQPTSVQLTINLKTAAALGLTVPRELLLRADATIS